MCIWCTTQLAKLSFYHSMDRTHSWRFSIFYNVQRTRLMYHAACKVEFQPFNRSYSQLTSFIFVINQTTTKKIVWNVANVLYEPLRRPDLPSFFLHGIWSIIRLFGKIFWTSLDQKYIRQKKKGSQPRSSRLGVYTLCARFRSYNRRGHLDICPENTCILCSTTLERNQSSC